jgi:two-component system, response regulator, stage 0 sporulation protein F
MDKVKVLIVDDEADLLTLMSEYVASWGYTPIAARCGKEALEKVNQESPNIVILDCMMPDMSGIEVLTEIRKFDQDLPAIMFTAYPDIQNIKGAHELGIVSFVPKQNDDALRGSLRAALAIAQKKINKAKD